MITVNDYEKQIDNIVYKDETYSVRDNGAVLRNPKNIEKPRKIDNIWTFGKQNKKTGYMEIAGERVHRIIATGFLGKAPTKEHLVDHIDTNRANNRPENLRWLTKLENAILNPITAKRIALVCGSIENFLNDPTKYRDKFKDPNISWMSTVSKEEANNCLNNFTDWAKKDCTVIKGGTVDSWIFKQKKDYYNKTAQNYENISYDSHKSVQSLTQNAKQDWSTPTKFPCCPKILTSTPLKDYFDKLTEGSIFGENRFTKYKVLKASFCDTFLIVLTEDNANFSIKPWCVNKVTFENNYFYHSVVKTCFDYNGAEKYFTIEQGLEWNGPDSIDDYC